MRHFLPFFLLILLSCGSNPKNKYSYTITTFAPTEFMGLDDGKPGEDIKVWGKRYLSDKGIALDFIITINNDTTIQKIVTIEDFKNRISNELIENGMMGVPTFCGYDEKNDSFLFHIEFSIPDTNVFKSIMIGIKRNGNFS